MRTLILLFIAALALARPETQAALIDGSAPGQVDLSFDLGSAYGPNGTVPALTVRPDGYILVGGYFTSIARMRK